MFVVREGQYHRAPVARVLDLLANRMQVVANALQAMGAVTVGPALDSDAARDVLVQAEQYRNGNRAGHGLDRQHRGEASQAAEQAEPLVEEAKARPERG